MGARSSGLQQPVSVPQDLREEDLLFGELLVRKGFCTREQVAECLNLQDQARKAIPANAPRLGDIIIRKGYIGMSQVEEVLKLREQIVVLTCPKCGSVYRLFDIDPKKKYVCKKTEAGVVCGTPLKAPGQTDSVALSKRSSFSLRPLPPEVREAATDPKRVFGKYVLLQELGRGGMGAVFKAWDTSLARAVALKFLLSESAAPGSQSGESDEVKRFFREAHTAAAVTHPSICQVYDMGVEDGKHFIAMQFIEGQSLSRQKQSPRQAATVIRIVALALEAAHQQGIVHRDIKPQNI
ncbi:MAG: protein kinase, partial [Planctomycetota bacterium]|nr:protein kinase [Planctomycetota bacterium]